MGLHQDFKDLLSAFDGAKVRYLLVGGYAVSFHSRPRYTKDIDLLIAAEPENLPRVQAALAHFGAPGTVMEALRTLAPDEILYMGNAPVRVDILQSIPESSSRPPLVAGSGRSGTASRCRSSAWRT